jgi:hypothetical protein
MESNDRYQQIHWSSIATDMNANNSINVDNKKRCSFVAPLFAAAHIER